MSRGIEAWILIQPENAGWNGASSAVRGNFLFADSENLDVGKTFQDQSNKIVAGRGEKANTRISGKQVPGGDLTWQFRSDEMPMVLMAHFQKFIGTAIGGAGSLTGSCQYTFVPEKGLPNFSGSAYGTGSYTSAAGDLFTLSVTKKFFNTSLNNGTNAQKFKSCIIDEIEVTAEADTDCKIKASFKAGTVDHGTAIPSSVDPSSSLGSYSTKGAYQYFVGTVLFGGTTQDVTKFMWTSKNQMEELITLGNLNPSRYKFGKVEVTGQLDLDMPKDGLRYFGSMIGGSSFSVYGTYYNSASDYMVVSMPNCRWQPFNANIPGGNADVSFGLPFKAYESDDGLTAPISVYVETTTWGSTPVTRV
jgi:hypothetical protein